MPQEEKNKKVIRSRVLLFGSFFLIIIGIIIAFKNKTTEIYINKKEQEQIDRFFAIESGEELNEKIVNKQSENQENYIAVLEISKINLKKGIYNKDSKNNDVSKNIKLIEESMMPDYENSNLILAAHNGTSRVSFFRNLPKLEINDIANVYYNGKKYSYSLINSYEVDKTGTVEIVRNLEKSILTLITCKHGTDKQLVYIFELRESEEI